MRLLHTSDWHLGRRLAEYDRHATYARFLDWLLEVLRAERVDALLVAGDIFDTTTPPHHAQRLYYSFLARVAQTGCRHVVIVAGNHDSPTLLCAAQTLLHSLNVHVVGAAGEAVEDEIVRLHREDGSLEAVVCAVPYLRERDIHHYAETDSLADKDAAVEAATASHYRRVVDAAQRQLPADHSVPLIATGHLFAAGCATQQSERGLYVGSLGVLPTSIFPDAIDYLALGHLHKPQPLKGGPTGAYSGSPIPFDFGESPNKSVRIVEFDAGSVSSRTVDVPAFDQLERIEGSIEAIGTRLKQLVDEKSAAYCEIVHTGSAAGIALKETVDVLTVGSDLRIVRICDNTWTQHTLSEVETIAPIEALSVFDVFEKRLSLVGELDDATLERLRTCYAEIVYEMNHDDANAR